MKKLSRMLSIGLAGCVSLVVIASLITPSSASQRLRSRKMVVYDANGTKVGKVAGFNDWEEAIVLFEAGELSFAVTFATDGAWTYSNRNEVVFESADCSGQAYLPAIPGGSPIAWGQIAGSSVYGKVSDEVPSTLTYNSSLNIGFTNFWPNVGAPDCQGGSSTGSFVPASVAYKTLVRYFLPAV